MLAAGLFELELADEEVEEDEEEEEEEDDEDELEDGKGEVVVEEVAGT